MLAWVMNLGFAGGEAAAEGGRMARASRAVMRMSRMFLIGF